MLIDALYHWSPRERRPGILRHGLRPLQPPTCTSVYEEEDEDDGAGFRQAMVCLSSAPSTAWGLSGNIFATPGQIWDLWQVRLVDTDAVHAMPTWGARFSELRVANRIPKSRCWWVAERTV